MGLPNGASGAYKVIKNNKQITDLDKLDMVKLDYGSLVSGLSQFLIMTNVPQSMTVVSKVAKNLVLF